MKYFLYCRRSSDREDRQSLSINAQLRELQSLAEKDSLEVIDTFIESQSAYKTGRSVFNEMLERISLGQADAILVWQANRLARNSLDGGRLIYMMDEGSIKEIRTVTKVFSTTGNDKFFLQIEFGMAKKSSDDTSDYMKRDLRSKLLKGEWPGMAPIGYLNVDQDGKIAGKFYDHEKQTQLLELCRPLRRIEKDPIVAPLLRQFFEYNLQEKRTLKEGADFINQLGVKSIRVKGKFSKSMIDGVLRNPFYYGAMLYTEEMFDGNHDPIISRDEYDKIQTYLSEKSRPITTRHEFVYRGLIKCAECGCAIVGVRKTKGSGKVYEYYTCSKRRQKCSQKPIKPYVIENQVEQKLQNVYIDERVWSLCKKLLKLHYGEQVESQKDVRITWEKELSTVETKLNRLLNLHISGDIEKDGYINKKAELLEEKALLQEKLNDSVESTTHWLQETEDFFDLSHAAYNTFMNGDLMAKKAMVKSIGWNLQLEDGILNWEYKKPFDVLANKILEFETVGTQEYCQGKKKNTSLNEEMIFWRCTRVGYQGYRGFVRAFRALFLWRFEALGSGLF